VRVTFLLLLALSIGCERRSSAVARETVRPVGNADASTASPAPTTTGARAVVERWNGAHNAHDLEILASLYAPKVVFYGTELTKAACVEKKRRAFATSPDYTQSIRDATFEPAEGGKTFVRLVKTSTTQGKSSNYPAIIVVDASGAIVEESDDLPEDWCLDKKTQGLALDAQGNDRVVAPFRMSANEALSKTRSSKHVQGFKELVGDMRNLTCARRCAVQTRECGFSVSLHDMNEHDQGSPSSLMGTVSIDPVTRTLWWEELSPDGGSVWVSEQL
jgi:hypothetical protein